MKRIISAVLVLVSIMTLFTLSASAEMSLQEATESALNEGFVTRRDCVSAIIKIVDKYDTFYMNYSQDVFSDLYFKEDYNSQISYDEHYKNLRIMTAYENGIVKGYEENGKYYFKPNDYITVKECLTLMMRCLTDKENVNWDTVIKDSINFNLLTEEEAQKINNNITPLKKTMYEKLISRFLNSKTYLCINSQDENDKNITYLEYYNKNEETSDDSEENYIKFKIYEKLFKIESENGNESEDSKTGYIEPMVGFEVTYFIFDKVTVDGEEYYEVYKKWWVVDDINNPSIGHWSTIDNFLVKIDTLESYYMKYTEDGEKYLEKREF